METVIQIIALIHILEIQIRTQDADLKLLPFI